MNVRAAIRWLVDKWNAWPWWEPPYDYPAGHRYAGHFCKAPVVIGGGLALLFLLCWFLAGCL